MWCFVELNVSKWADERPSQGTKHQTLWLSFLANGFAQKVRFPLGAPATRSRQWASAMLELLLPVALMGLLIWIRSEVQKDRGFWLFSIVLKPSFGRMFGYFLILIEFDCRTFDGSGLAWHSSKPVYRHRVDRPFRAAVFSCWAGRLATSMFLGVCFLWSYRSVSSIPSESIWLLFQLGLPFFLSTRGRSFCRKMYLRRITSMIRPLSSSSHEVIELSPSVWEFDKRSVRCRSC